MRLIKMLALLLVLIAISVSVALFVPAEYFVRSSPEDITYYEEATSLKLRRYEITGSPREMRTWLEGPHDGAFSQAIAYVFLEWSLSHPKDFVYIIEGIQDEKKAHISQWLGIMVGEAMIEDRFLKTFESFDSPVISQIKIEADGRRRQ